MTASGVEPRYPNFKDIMAAKNKEIEVISIKDIDFNTEQNMNFVNINNISTSKSGEKVVDEGEAFKVIIDKLKEIKAI